jgi:hypothetical protein
MAAAILENRLMVASFDNYRKSELGYGGRTLIAHWRQCTWVCPKYHRSSEGYLLYRYCLNVGSMG